MKVYFWRVRLVLILVCLKRLLINITRYNKRSNSRSLRIWTSFGMACSRLNTRESMEDIYDRSSDLPYVLLQHILSFLDPKEAARTSVLSKSWLRSWATRPIHDFDANVNKDFIKLVNNLLRNYHRKRMTIQEFRLHIKGPDSCVARLRVSDHVQKMLQLVAQMVVEGNILELDLSTVYYSFVLRDRDIKCCKLKKLKLEWVPIDDRSFHYLISSCPLIEQLHLEDCQGLTKIHAATIPNLREFHLSCRDVKVVNVNVPRLESCTCYYVGVFKIGESANLKNLSLTSSGITDKLLRRLLSKSPLLEELRLDSCDNLEELVISSLSFKHLILHDCSRLVQAKIVAPNLHLLEYFNWWKQTPLLLTSPAIKGESSIRFQIDREIHADWFQSLREFLTKFRKSSVTVVSHNKRWWRNEGRIEVIPLPSEHEVETLLLEQYIIHLDLLEGLLSMCHPKLVICEFHNSWENKGTIRNLCQKLRPRRVLECCGSSQIKCWRHYIKQAQHFYEVDNERKPLDWERFIMPDMDWWRLKNPSLSIPSIAPKGLEQQISWRIVFALDWKPL